MQALAQWRFQAAKNGGKKSAFVIGLTVPVRRPIDRQVERSLRREWRAASTELQEALDAGEKLDAASAARLEKGLSASAESIDGRATLLAYLASVPAGSAPEEIRKTRAGQIAWLVERWPEADILGAPFALINAAGDPLADRPGYEHVRDLWLQQLSRDPANTALLEHATNFLRVADPDRAEQMLLPVAARSREAAIWLGNLYGLAAVGATGLDLRSGVPVSAGASVPETGFGRRAREVLKATGDARILLPGVAVVTSAGRSLAKSGHLPSGYEALCQELVHRAKLIYPATSASCDTSAAPEEAPLRLRVGGNVQQAKLLRQARPIYPGEARSRGIQGTVQFQATIDQSGDIRNLELVSGPLPLYESAREAVSQWKYRPTLLEGKPIEVVTRIDVNYALSR